MNLPHPTVEDLFFAARERQDPAARSAYLDEACGSDSELRRRLEGLLSVESKVSRFLESPAVSPSNRPGALVGDENVGAIIGPYKLIEVIGEGGMGVVYLAEQTSPVRRTVALKLIKPGMDTKRVIARFEAERQALALMDHPNIAKVHDAGATESGRPYFVMELVRGIPITDYCDREKLSIPERLELFVLVCRAVQHAHQKGIIHRDLKPSNVLVTIIDRVAVPKIIDFGVAKATGGSLTERTLFTAFDQFIGTPRYMSPEQAELGSLEVDTRSDVYGLGVLLYELLTGTTPFDEQTFRQASFDEIRRIIQQQEPPRPSTRLSALGETATSVSADRQSDPRKLNRSLRGELDWIVMKCLEKDRTRRYETANDLVRDLMRYLADQPVEASPPSAWYRFAKSVRRHRVALATAGIVSVALIAGTAVSTWQAIRATKAEKRTATALDEAKQQRRLAERHLHAALLRQVRQAIDMRHLDQAHLILDGTQTGLDGTLLRDFVWYYLRRIVRRELVLLPGSDLGLFATSLSRDGRTLAALYSWSLIVLLDLPSERPRLTMTAAPGTKWVAPRLTTDGRILVVMDHTAGDDKHFKLEIWDTATGRLGATRSIGHPLPRPTHDGATQQSTEFLAGERMIAFLWEVETGQVLIRTWDLDFDPRKNQPLLALDGLDAVAVAAEGTLLAVQERSRLSLRDVRTGAVRREIPGDLDGVRALALSPDGRTIAAAVPGRGVLLWDTTSGTEQQRYNIGEPVMKLLFGPRGTTLAAVDENGLVHLWDRPSGQAQVLRPDDRDRRRDMVVLSFSADGSRVAASSRANPGGYQPVAIWEVATGHRLGTLPCRAQNANCPLFTSDGRSLIVDVERAPRIWHFDPPSEPPALAGHVDEAWAVTYSPDGRILASGSDDTEDDDAIKLWESDTGRLLRGWRAGTGTVAALAFSPDGRTLASAALSPTENLRFWDVTDGRLLMTLEGHTDKVRSVAFSPDGKTLASAGSDRTVRLWDVATGRPLAALAGHTNVVRKIAFSPDGHTLASVSNDMTVRLWDVVTGQVRHVFRGPEEFASVVFSPDGSLLVAADEGGNITIWDPSTGARHTTIHGDHAEIFALSFSPDGCNLAAAGKSRVIRLWDPLTGQELLALNGHAAQINGLAFSPDGRTLASCSHDGAVKLWRSQETRPAP